MTPAEFAKFIADDAAKWDKVVKFSAGKAKLIWDAFAGRWHETSAPTIFAFRGRRCGAAGAPPCRACRRLSEPAGAHVGWLHPGAAPDVVARLFGQWLGERLGQPFVVENRPPAAAISRPSRSCARRRTVTCCSCSRRRNAIDTTLLDTLNFDLARDIAPVAGLIDLPMLLSVNRPFRQNAA